MTAPPEAKKLDAPPPANPAAPAAAAKDAPAREPSALAKLQDKIHSWPYFVRAEFIAGCVLMLVLLVWSIGIDAPLEEPANPAKTPNPSKAPWYFLGLQEMLVYFDPWIAGVVLPSLIIVGLMVIPYIDINPKGNGYYTWKERKFAISTFLVGFLGLWIGMIFIGVFMRGPGWNLFMPWDYWDPHKVVPLTNIDLPYFLGIRSQLLATLFGLVCIGTWLVGIPMVVWLWKREASMMKQLGVVRYAIVSSLFMMMAGTVVKMALRLAFNIKYVLVIPNILNV
jgi:Cytochrome b(C-terminal)/b6/petD